MIKKVTEHHKKKAKQAQRQLGIDRKKLKENNEDTNKLEKSSTISSADWTVKEQDLNALQAHRARAVDVVRKERV